MSATAKQYSENIPFFSELPADAVKVAARLWDAIQRPDYNGVVAYTDFVQDLRRLGIDAPPRAVVNRWRAGVQANLIGRPVPVASVPDELKEVARKQRDAGRKARAEAKLVDALVAHPETGKPVQPTMKVFADPETRLCNDVSVAFDENPMSTPDHEDDFIREAEALTAEPSPVVPPGWHNVDVTAAAAFDVAGAAADNDAALLGALLGVRLIDAPPYNGASKSVTEAALVAVQAAAGRLLEENIIQLSQSIERTAREDTARMLRAMADEMEGGAV